MPGPDGTIITENTISDIRSGSGNGQNGNAINVFRADGVIVANNVASDVDFSAVRLNSTKDCLVRGNVGSECREVAIFSEFAFSGSVIAENIIDGAAAGISITNFNDGGRLAVCQGNIVRNIYPSSPTNPDTRPFGIFAEADTAITGNVIEEVPGIGIGAGWGEYLRDVLISGNVIRETEFRRRRFGGSGCRAGTRRQQPHFGGTPARRVRVCLGRSAGQRPHHRSEPVRRGDGRKQHSQLIASDASSNRCQTHEHLSP